MHDEVQQSKDSRINCPQPSSPVILSSNSRSERRRNTAPQNVSVSHNEERIPVLPEVTSPCTSLLFILSSLSFPAPSPLIYSQRCTTHRIQTRKADIPSLPLPGHRLHSEYQKMLSILQSQSQSHGTSSQEHPYSLQIHEASDAAVMGTEAPVDFLF